MTDKQIIIDGVDVSGCAYFGSTMSPTKNCTMDSEYLHSCESCYCYYKQLKKAMNQIVELNKKVETKEQECEELKKEIKSYQCNEKNANRCTCAFRCLENTFCNEAENKIDEIQTKIKVLKIENEILSNKLGQEENWHKSSDEISKANSEYTAKLKAENDELTAINARLLGRLEVDETDASLVFNLDKELRQKEKEFYTAIQKVVKLKQTLTEIKEIAETQRRYIDDIKGFMVDDKLVEWKSAYIDFSTACRRLNQEILQKISECEGNDGN